VKYTGKGGRVYCGALAIGTLGAWELKQVPAAEAGHPARWALDAEATIARFWCNPKPPRLRVELVKMVPAHTKRGTEAPPLVPSTQTKYGNTVRVRPDSLMLIDLKDTDGSPKPTPEPDIAG
jgi:hypothetical protein